MQSTRDLERKIDHAISLVNEVDHKCRRIEAENHELRRRVQELEEVVHRPGNLSLEDRIRNLEDREP